ncbi:hypothetical protein [Streptomyces sp. NPDC056512]|uniref:hypothetical protein n=1 Tax=Streptomyces sp. NPDC056512 TaxID=3345846 RepID=UPI0036C4D1A1
MTARRRRRAPPAELPPGGVLNWRDPSHWSWTEKPCRYCGHDTHLRDSKRSPAHKVCAETALAQQVAEAADAYQNGTL